MRKCIFRRLARVDEFRTPSMLQRVPVYEDAEGTFHQWGMESEEVEGGSLNHSVAIVEMPDGTIETPIASRVRFVDPLPA